MRFFIVGLITGATVMWALWRLEIFHIRRKVKPLLMACAERKGRASPWDVANAAKSLGLL